MKTLKKYPNRRIYDAEAKTFLKLADIHQMVLDKLVFTVVDSKTGDDLTGQTLLQIITELESEGQKSMLTNRVLEELIRFYGDEMAMAMRPYLEQQILGFLDQQQLMRDQFKTLVDSPQARYFKQMADQFGEFLKTGAPAVAESKPDKP